MVTYSAAPLENESVALIEPFALKGLFPTDGSYNFSLFNALGFSRILNSVNESLKSDPEARNSFAADVKEASQNFRENAGLYITDDIVNSLSADSVIAKISVTDESVNDFSSNVNGGVVAFVLPTSEELNGIVITSGGLSSPAFSHNVGVSVLPTEYAFQTIADDTYTIASIILDRIEEEAGTYWTGGTNIALTIYRSTGVGVKRVHQQFIRKLEDGTLVTKEADANKDGYISVNAWSDFEPGDDVVTTFVNRSHAKLADLLNSLDTRPVRLTIAGAAEDGLVEGDLNTKRFSAVVIDSSVSHHGEDAFGFDEHPAHIEDFGAVDNAEPVAEEPQIEDPESGYTGYGHREEVVSNVITSPEEIETASDLVEFAEYEVTHSEEPAVTGEVNDPSAETDEPFSLGAEYLINEGIDEDVSGSVDAEQTSTPVEVFEEANKDDVAENEFSLADIPLVDDSGNEHLQWSEVVTGSVDNVEDEEPDATPDAEFADLSWDEVALTIADDSSDADDNDKPIRGFLGRN